jgi:hypothetical protein
MKVVNEDGVSVTTKVKAKQFRYIPITPRLEWLSLSDIMSHPRDGDAW